MLPKQSAEDILAQLRQGCWTQIGLLKAAVAALTPPKAKLKKKRRKR